MEEKGLTKYTPSKGVIAICMVALLLSGCSFQVGEAKGRPNTSQRENEDSLELEPDLSYEVPSVKAGVLVSQIGYNLVGTKKVIFSGSQLPEKFDVINVKTQKTVYTANISEKWFDEQKQTYIGYGEFSGFQTEGEYYIQCQYIGRSYAFYIKNDFYQIIMEEALENLQRVRQLEDTESIEKSEAINPIEYCYSISSLLLSFEIYPQAHEDGSALLKNEIPDVLDEVLLEVEKLANFQDSVTGSVGEATAWFCAAMAKFSYTYQKYDSVVATKYLQLADRAWKYIEKNKENFKDSQRLFAATELYRATGKYTYHSLVKELGNVIQADMKDDAYVFAATTYAATKRNVDVKLCGAMLQAIMDEAKSISESSKANKFFACANLEEEGMNAYLREMTIMSISNYVITNQEYATVIENHQDYLLGKNEKGICYIGLEGNEKMEEIDIFSSLASTSQYILMISEIISQEEK